MNECCTRRQLVNTLPRKRCGSKHTCVLFITMTSQWPRWRLKSPASQLFTQPFIQTQIKENIKAPRHWPLCGEFTGDRWNPAQRASYAENVSIWWRHHVYNQYQLISLALSVQLVLVECQKIPLIIRRSLVQVMTWCHQGTGHYLSQWPVTRKMFPFDDVIMFIISINWYP